MYSRSYYIDRQVGSTDAARAILDLVLNAVSVRTLCDVGCGTGTWIKVATEMGIEDVVGFEGAWVDEDYLVVPPEFIRRQDLEQPINVDRRFDLAICLELVEHLSPTRGPELVAELCRLADAVLFSAAVPHQRGVGHVNEQWQSYWAAHFEQHGYRAFDLVRPKIWADDRIPFWYRQNTLFYVARDSEGYDQLPFDAANPGALDIVHPALYQRQLYPSGKRAAMQLTRAVAGLFGWWVKKQGSSWGN